MHLTDVLIVKFATRMGAMLRRWYRSLAVTGLIGMSATRATAQRAGTTMRDSVGDAAAALLNHGRTNEARITLLRAMRAARSPELRAIYRLELGDTFLYDGQYQEAARAYNAVLGGRD